MLHLLSNFKLSHYLKVAILDGLWQHLPRPPFTEEDAESLADVVYGYVWQRSASGNPLESR